MVIFSTFSMGFVIYKSYDKTSSVVSFKATDTVSVTCLPLARTDTLPSVAWWNLCLTLNCVCFNTSNVAVTSYVPLVYPTLWKCEGSNMYRGFFFFLP